jgi:hypothetical protein
MIPAIRPGARVLLRWAGVPHASPCHLHLQADLPLFQRVGVVDKIDERYGDHRASRCSAASAARFRERPGRTAVG